MARSYSTRRFTPRTGRTYTWLVLVGETTCTEHYVECHTFPSEKFVRVTLRLDGSVPIVIGRP